MPREQDLEGDNEEEKDESDLLLGDSRVERSPMILGKETKRGSRSKGLGRSVYPSSRSNKVFTKL